jgi:mannose-1-phosphate guanylyltransferase
MSSKKYQDHLYALIVAGGGGTRLWPKSRNKTPKQFLNLFGNTLTQITIERFRKIIPWEKIFIVTTTKAYKDEILKEVPKIHEKNVIVEPCRRNTAPAHGLGAAFIYRKDKEAVILNESADHLVKPTKLYFKTLKAAAEAAFSGDWLIAVGIKPTYPNIGYGHIKRGKYWGLYQGKKIFKLSKFTEKPPLPLAIKFTESGKYYWNANQYVWRADTYLNALRKHEPRVGGSIDKIIEAVGSKAEKGVIDKEYKRMPETTQEGKPLSVDYAVSEKADNFLLIIADYNWTDIGDWKEVWENLPKDDKGNVIIDGDAPGGEVLNIDTSDALIHTDGRLVAVVDIDNVVVVDTKNALLVCSKSRCQEVKKIVKELKKKKRVEFL